MSDDTAIEFPEGFVWGAATAAYQIEGHRRADGGGECIWDVFAREGGTLNGDNGDIAADHYRRYPEDHALAKDSRVRQSSDVLQLAAVFSLTACRTATRPDSTHYDRVLDSLLEHGLTPMVTLYHWDLPQALQEKGGWLNRDTASHFADHADAVTKHFGDRVPYWTTTNEPWSCAFLGHARGLHAPGVRDYQCRGRCNPPSEPRPWIRGSGHSRERRQRTGRSCALSPGNRAVFGFGRRCRGGTNR